MKLQTLSSTISRSTSAPDQYGADSTEQSSVSLLTALNSLRPLVSRADKWRYVMLFVALFFGAFLDMLGLSLIPGVVAVATSPEKFGDWPVLGDAISNYTTIQLLIFGVIAIVCVFVLKTIYFLFMYRFQFRLIASQRVKLSKQLFAAYIHAPWAFHLNRNSSELMRNIAAETNEIVNGIFTPAVTVVLGTITTLLILAMNVAVLPFSCVIAITLLLGAVGLLMSRLRVSLARVGKESKLEKKRTIRAINEGLSAVLDWKLFGREEFMVDRFARSVQRFAESDRYMKTIHAILPYVIETTAVFIILFMLIFLSWGGVELASLTTYVSVMAVSLIRLRQSVTVVFAGIGQMYFSRAAIDSVVTDVQQLQSGVPKPGERAAVKALCFNHSLDFRNVTFTYGGDRTEPALENVSFKIALNESVAFVGPTGSGKSTIINLLLGFLKPTTGDITVDGVSIWPNAERWQCRIGYVPQSILLLDDTIIRNVAFGIHEDDIDLDRVQQVLEMAQLNLLDLTCFPEGLQTVVGERGVRLSGGQRQRIGIARALYHQPAVIIMDEATSALDSGTEAQLIATLRDFRPQVTFVFVAHRITTVSHCDRIYCIESGKLAAFGTHSKLFEESRLYQSLAT